MNEFSYNLALAADRKGLTRGERKSSPTPLVIRHDCMNKFKNVLKSGVT